MRPMCALRPSGASRGSPKSHQQKPKPVFRKFSHFAQAVGKDVEFMRKGICTGLQWANNTRISQVSKAIDDLLWLRNLEDPEASSFNSPSWPHPHYPELNGIDLLMADLKVLEAYANYFLCLTKMWSKPLFEVYDPQIVADYFSCRPHVVTFRLLEAWSELHDQILPFPRTVSMKIIEEDLGSPVESVFRYISEEPGAAASFGQVYRGCTTEGVDVAVKVQCPNLRHVVIQDIFILRLGLGLVRKIAKRKSDIRLYADELGKGLVGELDYRMEGANARKLLKLCFLTILMIQLCCVGGTESETLTTLGCVDSGCSFCNMVTLIREKKVTYHCRLLRLFLQ